LKGTVKPKTTIIYEEMGKMGAVLTDGKWNKDGKPVVIKFMIRTEDERRTIGDLLLAMHRNPV